MDTTRWQRYRRIFRRSVQNEIDDEVSFHFQLRIDEFVAGGMSRAEAAASARARFGDVAAVRADLEVIDGQRRRRLDFRERLDGIRQDFVVALRALRRAPVFAAGMLLTLGLGIGANATMFGVIDRLLVSGPAQVHDARHLERLYFAETEGRHGAWNAPITSYAAFAAIRSHTTLIRSMGAYGYYGLLRFGRGSTAHRVPLATASWDFFTTLGTRPMLGRFFTAAEDHAPRGEAVIVLSSAFWQSECGGDSSIIGKPVTFGETSYVVVGVAPPGFTGLDGDRPAGWVPVSVNSPNSGWESDYNTQWLRVVARLADGASPEQANAEATAIFRSVYTGFDANARRGSVVLRPLWYGEDGVRTPTVNISVLLAGVATAMLLIVSANAANLLLSRTLRRRPEIAVRIALGIGTARLVRLIGAEAGMLALGGAMVGVVVAHVGGQLMRATLLSGIPVSGSVVSLHVLLFTAGAAMFVCLLLALVPAVYASRVSVGAALKSGVREGGRRRGAIRNTLFVVQAALCVILLTAAGLFVESFARLRSIDLGFEPARMMNVYASFNQPNVDESSPAATARQTQRLVELRNQLASVPSIEQAAVVIGGPYSSEFGVPLFVPGRDSLPRVPGGGPFISSVSPDFFAVIGAHLVHGRFFTNEDRPNGDQIVIVGQTLANTVWPGGDAIGQCLLIHKRDSGCATVVGIVADVHRRAIREAPALQYYVPLGQDHGIGGAHLLVRARGEPALVTSVVRRIAATIPDFVSVEVTPGMQGIDAEVRPWRLGAILFGVFGVLALVVASAGLYSVIAYVVADRTHEMGVRMALGATGSQLVRLMVGSGVRLVVIGVTIAVAAIVAAGRFIEPLLFETTSREPGLLAGVAVILLVVATAAAYFPARRVTAIDPMRALRAD